MKCSPRILIVIQNAPLQRDSRVQRQCLALLRSGYRVCVACPTNDLPVAPELARVALYSFPAPPPGASKLGFLYEYAYSLVAIAIMLVRAARQDGLDVIQVCNPPDLLFLVASPFRLLGTRVVFDHHDPSPEMYEARFEGTNGVLHALLLLFERMTFASVDHVISTNESLREFALRRGHVPPEGVTVVRNAPSLAQASRCRPDVAMRGGRRFMGCWLGDMGPDDGVDLALRAIEYQIRELGRTDCQYVFLGDGELRSDLEALAAELGIEPWVVFPGWVSHDVLARYLSTAHIALAPDPRNSRSDASTTMKIMDYMAFNVPIVAYEVRETRVSAGPAALYAEPGHVRGFATLMEQLLESEDQRRVMGQIGRRRFEESLAWDHQERIYTGLFEELLASPRRRHLRRSQTHTVRRPRSTVGR